RSRPSKNSYERASHKQIEPCRDAEGTKNTTRSLRGASRSPQYIHRDSRGDAHPRITGCESKYKSCWTLQEARTYMERMGATKVKEVIKSGAGETTPLGGNGFYAVASGKKPGIYPFYYGESGAEKEVTEEKGSCHKRFRTMAQAEAFIEDWKETYAQIWHEIIKNALDRGHRPRNSDAFRPHKMGSIINLFLCEACGCRPGPHPRVTLRTLHPTRPAGG
ncbi:hypothetical protein F1880_008939, partial [Penicillium rolfsii]